MKAALLHHTRGRRSSETSEGDRGRGDPLPDRVGGLAGLRARRQAVAQAERGGRAAPRQRRPCTAPHVLAEAHTRRRVYLCAVYLTGGMSRALLKLGGGSVEILRDVRH